jgi:cytochrome bd ubiquinol oxidase subunit II
MFVVLASLIFRPVAFKYRSKRPDPRWRAVWDWALFAAGVVPPLIFGVAVGNVLQGVPFRLTDEMRMIYEGTFFGLLNPFALLCGLLSLSMLVMHGGAWLGLKASGNVAERGRRYGSYAAIAAIVLFAAAGLALWLSVLGYRITSPLDAHMPSDPLIKTVVREGAGWFSNYARHPWIALAPALGFAGAAAAFIGLRRGREVATFVASKLAVVGIIATVGLSMFPFILPSSADPRSSLIVWDSASSHSTLFNMLVVTLIFLPIVMAYTAWVYHVLWGKVDEATIQHEDETLY